MRRCLRGRKEMKTYDKFHLECLYSRDRSLSWIQLWEVWMDNLEGEWYEDWTIHLGKGNLVVPLSTLYSLVADRVMIQSRMFTDSSVPFKDRVILWTCWTTIRKCFLLEILQLSGDSLLWHSSYLFGWHVCDWIECGVVWSGRPWESWVMKQRRIKNWFSLLFTR